MENEKSRVGLWPLHGSQQMGLSIPHTQNNTAIPKVSQAQKSITGYQTSFRQKRGKGGLA